MKISNYRIMKVSLSLVSGLSALLGYSLASSPIWIQLIIGPFFLGGIIVLALERKK